MSNQQNDVINEMIADAIVEGVSNCCGAQVYEPDLCRQCGEHCAIEKDEHQS